jgi:CrcB protein
VNTVSAWLWLAAGGAAGTLLRYAVSGWIMRATGGTFPWGTLAINAAGCLGIGVLAGLLDRGGLLSTVLRMSLMVGVLGGFTTFSSFGLETFRLLADAQWGAAAAYVLLSNASALASVWLGHRVISLA